jgi:hypothetical protein
LHATAFVEESLRDNRVLRWNRTKNGSAGNNISDDTAVRLKVEQNQLVGSS